MKGIRRKLRFRGVRAVEGRGQGLPVGSLRVALQAIAGLGNRRVSDIMWAKKSNPSNSRRRPCVNIGRPRLFRLEQALSGRAKVRVA